MVMKTISSNTVADALLVHTPGLATVLPSDIKEALIAATK